ncbi:hypothetical protein AVEN_254345-1 [Araneus ventricosus]|uniref:Uncharacterized protein n=1 Tax=Araneus ventricosus TaxID=182803 RepID=A0A4Y2TT98_ARAVE|nr:hypothetical protein AVEN_254345-1 [Araneus ventricosus]
MDFSANIAGISMTYYCCLCFRTIYIHLLHYYLILSAKTQICIIDDGEHFEHRKERCCSECRERDLNLVRVFPVSTEEGGRTKLCLPECQHSPASAFSSRILPHPLLGWSRPLIHSRRRGVDSKLRRVKVKVEDDRPPPDQVAVGRGGLIIGEKDGIDRLVIEGPIRLERESQS